MSDYSRTRGNVKREPVGDARICADCGRAVSPDDRYCPGCGVAFAGAPARTDRSLSLPGFQYHLVQGLGWGLGFALAALIVFLISWLLAVLVIHGSIRV